MTRPPYCPENRDRFTTCAAGVRHCLPRLRERREEIAPHAQRFLDQAPELTGVEGTPIRFAAEALQALEAATYPGNLRDLREAVVRAYLHATADGVKEVRLEHLQPAMQTSLKFERRGNRAAQLRVVSWALWKTGDQVREAAKLIGASRNTVGALRAELGALLSRPQASMANCPRISQRTKRI